MLITVSSGRDGRGFYLIMRKTKTGKIELFVNGRYITKARYCDISHRRIWLNRWWEMYEIKNDPNSPRQVIVKIKPDEDADFSN